MNWSPDPMNFLQFVFQEKESGSHGSYFKQKAVQKRMNWSPKEKTENWERANVYTASCDGREYSTDESGENQSDCLPQSEVDNRIVSFTFFLSEILSWSVVNSISSTYLHGFFEWIGWEAFLAHKFGKWRTAFGKFQNTNSA